MSKEKDPVKEYLLGQTPGPRDVPAYRESINKTLLRGEKRLRIERILAKAAWIFCAVSSAVWIWWSGPATSSTRAPFLACIFMIIGAVEILKYQISSSHIGILTEMKQLQLQLFELEQRLRSDSPR